MHRLRNIIRLSRAEQAQSSLGLPKSCPRCASPSLSPFVNVRKLQPRGCAPSSSSLVRFASVQSGKTPAHTTAPLPPEMGSSLDQLVPKSLFETSDPAGETITEPLARRIVEVVLTQLRAGIDAPTQGEVDKLQDDANKKVLSIMTEASASASSLHYFATQMLRASKDPRRSPIAFRLFEVAFGLDPMKLDDPTASQASKDAGQDPSLASVPIAGENAWGVNAAGYSWASMVLSGQAQPPPGIHLLQRGSSEYTSAISRQQAAAVRIYATLAMRGDAQGMLGMGKVLLAGLQRQTTNAPPNEQQISLMRDRIIAMWTKAGQLGVGEAWFELGLLYLGPTAGFKPDEAKAHQYFELGAKQDNFRCHHALGVIHTQSAMADNQSPSTQHRLDNLSKSLHHFTSAAKLGDPQSAHNLGLRYLLRDEMIDEIQLGQESDGRTDEKVLSQAKSRHESLWGVAPDDVEAMKWFRKAADQGSIPAMMNYAGMLVEARGRLPSGLSDVGNSDLTLIGARLQELKKAESLYSKAAAHGNVLAQQQQQAAPKGSAAGSTEVNVGKEMASFAQEALAKVQEMMQALMKEQQKLDDMKKP